MNERLDPNRPDEAALAEYLKGGSSVSQRYQEMSSEEVPANLDERVLDMARAAAAGTKKRGGSPWLRWSAPLALAASAVLVVSIVIESGVYKGEDPVAAQRTVLQQAPEAPAAEIEAQQRPREEESRGLSGLAMDTQSAAPPAAPAVARAEAEKAAQVAADARRAQELLDQTARKASVEQREFAASPPPAAAEPRPDELDAPTTVTAGARESASVSQSPASLDEVAVTSARARRDASAGSGPRNTVRPAAAASRYEQAADASEVHATPESWLEHIRELRSQGREREADEEWERFRKSHPDYVVAEDDRARPSD